MDLHYNIFGYCCTKRYFKLYAVIISNNHHYTNLEVSTMKSTGIVRKVDELGRIVIPIELRRNLGVAEKDAMEIFLEENRIILCKYIPNIEKESVAEGLKNLEKLTEEERQDIISRAINIINSNK